VSDHARETTPVRGDQQRSAAQQSPPVFLDDRVITADLLSERVNGAAVITVGPKSLITPSARDFLRDRGLELQRSGDSATPNASASVNSGTGTAKSTLAPLLVVVRNTPAVDRLWEDLQYSWKRELLGCPDDAARLAISALTRGESACVVILAEQAHRAACLANRNEHVKAVALRDAAEARWIEKQLRANVWCLDPTGLSYFEVKNLFRHCEHRRGAS
jgi:hypothetical protein